ncbi:MAG: Crp/Fnr family transcriptional regulator [Chloroflexota bacterium]
MDIEERVAAIVRSGLFQGVPDTLVRRLAERAEVQEITAGGVLFEQGDVLDKMGLLVEGKLAVSAVINGLEVVVNIHDPGAWFRLFALTAHRPTEGRFRGVFPGKVLWLDGDETRRLLEQEPEVGLLVMTRVATLIGDRYRILMQAIRRSLREEWKGLEDQAIPQQTKG